MKPQVSDKNDPSSSDDSVSETRSDRNERVARYLINAKTNAHLKTDEGLASKTNLNIY